MGGRAVAVGKHRVVNKECKGWTCKAKEAGNGGQRLGGLCIRAGQAI